MASCSICLDNLFPSVEPTPGNAGVGNFDLEISYPVATLCGHLFHNHCIQKWFNAKNVGKPRHARVNQCPNCQTIVRKIKGVIKIYRNNDENEVPPNAAPTPDPEMEKKIMELTRKNKKLKILKRTQRKALAAEKRENEALKLELERLKNKSPRPRNRDQGRKKTVKRSLSLETVTEIKNVRQPTPGCVCIMCT